ncbi:MAG: glycosyltransferase, partial [Actinobacteria bacterium]|nr:glycosyltransferase [Actinomycetota bacterium]
MSVAAVIVTHNSAHFIAETLESVKRQTQLPDFIAVIDDHS